MRLKREDYLREIRPFYEADLIKVITGVRRCGKSILLESIRDELRESGVPEDCLVFLNLEDLAFAFIRDAADLNREILSRVAGKGRCYLFLDEIQHVIGFEKALASFRATLDVSIFVTGSSSTLLSGELATLLTGRTVEFEIRPFSFSEMGAYCRLNGLPFSDEAIYDYIKWGGFPVRFDFRDEAAVKRYLEDLYRGIVNRDIASSSSRFDRRAFDFLSRYVLANAGREFSADSLAKEFAISRRSVYNYIERMKNACLIQGVGKKYYAVDMGLRMFSTNTVNFAETFFLENVVYNELKAQGFTVFAGKTFKGEVDFVAVKNGKKCFIQVAYLLASEATLAREFGAFDPIRDASPKYMLSLDKIDMSRNGIAHVNVVDFLLRRVALALT